MGTVGSGTFEVLRRNQEEIRRRAGRGSSRCGLARLRQDLRLRPVGRELAGLDHRDIVDRRQRALRRGTVRGALPRPEIEVRVSAVSTSRRRAGLIPKRRSAVSTCSPK